MKLCSEVVHTLRARWTDYKLEMRTNVPIFKVKEASVRRRYSDFKVKILFQFFDDDENPRNFTLSGSETS